MFKTILSVNCIPYLKTAHKNSVATQANNLFRITYLQKYCFARKFVINQQYLKKDSPKIEKGNEIVEPKLPFNVELFENQVKNAMNLFNFNKLDNSLKIFYEIIKLFDEPLNDKEFIQLGNVYNMIGRIYNKKGETEKSLNYYYKSLNIMRRYLPNEPDCQQKLAEMYYNIGVIKLNYLINDLEEDNIYTDDFGNEVDMNKPNNSDHNSKLDEPNTKEITQSKKRFEVKSEEVLEELDKAKEIMNFLIGKYPSNLKKYATFFKQIHRNYSYYYLNEMEIKKSIESIKDLFDCHIKAFGEKNKETIEIGLEISNKLLQYKKFLECVEFTERILQIINSFPNEIYKELAMIHFNMYVCEINLLKLDSALKHILECLKIKEILYNKFEEEIDKKLDFMDIMGEENKMSERQLMNLFDKNPDDSILNSLEVLLNNKINNNSTNTYLNDILEQIKVVKRQRDDKLELKAKLKKARELQYDIEDNAIEIIKKSDDPKEKYLSIRQQMRFELGYINEKICEIYLKKKYKKDAYYYCYDSLKYYEDLEVSRLHRVYSNMALIFNGCKNFMKCIDFAKKALFCDNVDDNLKVNNGELYYLIANSYSNLKNFEKALKYQEKAVKFCELIYGENNKKYATLTQRLAHYYKLTGNVGKAEKYYEIAYSLNLKENINKNLRTNLCIIAFEIGSIKYEKNDYLSALKFYDSIMNNMFNHKLDLPKYIVNTILNRKNKIFEEAKKNPKELMKIIPEIEQRLKKLSLKDRKLNNRKKLN